METKAMEAKATTTEAKELVEVSEDELEERLKHKQSVAGISLQRLPPLYYAAVTFNSDLFLALLATGVGVDVNWAQPDTGISVLHFCAENDVPAELEAALKAGADVKAVTLDRMAGRGDYVSGGLTPLHLAAARGKTASIALLLRHGADAAARDWCGRTPLIHALQWGHAAAAELLAPKAAAAAAHAHALPSAEEVRAMKVQDRDTVRERMAKALEDRKRALLARLAAAAAAGKDAKFKAVIVPCADCSPFFSSHWYVWLAEQLSALGMAVAAPWDDMPEPMACRERIWTAYIRKELMGSHPPERTVLIGHSTGGNAVLRLLEQTVVLGAVVVACGQTKKSDDDGDEQEPTEEEKKDYGYFDRPWDWERIRGNARSFLALLHSQDDAVVPVEQGRQFAADLRLRATTTKTGDSDSGSSSGKGSADGDDAHAYLEFDGRGHFQDKTLPEAVAIVRRCLKL